MLILGLKLWSNNSNYVNEAVKLYEKGIYQYIELYVLPDIKDSIKSLWKSINIPYVIHAPHYQAGLNLAKKERKKDNLILINKTQEVADLLGADKIIVHPGVDGDIKETVSQLKEINDPRILIENKPYYALLDDLLCNGATIEEVKFVLEYTGVGFCLDIGHAFNTANAKKIEPIKYLKQFLKIKTEIFHLTDGDVNDIYDSHEHIGKGNYNIKAILDILPKDCFVTVETVKDFKDSLADFEEDVKTLRSYEFKYQIKLATEDDMMGVFKLSNDPVVRKNSFNQEPILIEDHEKWFINKINDDDCIFYIVRGDKGELIGCVRFDKNPEKDFLISISLDSKYRGKGLGRKIINQTSSLILELNKTSKIIACIKEGNRSSLESFLKAGYELTGKDSINNTPCNKLQFRTST